VTDEERLDGVMRVLRKFEDEICNRAYARTLSYLQMQALCDYYEAPDGDDLGGKRHEMSVVIEWLKTIDLSGHRWKP
jgi:hypothetical protein